MMMIWALGELRRTASRFDPRSPAERAAKESRAKEPFFSAGRIPIDRRRRRRPSSNDCSLRRPNWAPSEPSEHHVRAAAAGSDRSAEARQLTLIVAAAAAASGRLASIAQPRALQVCNYSRCQTASASVHV